EQRLSIIEAAAVSVETGLTQQRHGNYGLAGSGGSHQQKIVGAAPEVEAGEAVDLRLVDAWLAFEREAVERPAPRQMCLVETVGEAALASRRRLRGEQPLQQLDGRCRLALGALNLSVERRADAGEAQLGQQGLQLVTHRRLPWHRARRSRRRPAAAPGSPGGRDRTGRTAGPARRRRGTGLPDRCA